MFTQYLKNKNLDQTPIKQINCRTDTIKSCAGDQNIPIPSQAKDSSITPTRFSKRISFFDSRESVNYSPVNGNHNNNNYPRSAASRATSSSSSSQLQISLNHHANSSSNGGMSHVIPAKSKQNIESQVVIPLKLQQKYPKNSDEKQNEQHPSQFSKFSQCLAQQLAAPEQGMQTQQFIQQNQVVSQHQHRSQSDQGFWVEGQTQEKQNSLRAHHKKQDSLMGSVCEFSDNQEQVRKIPPQMQMQASKMHNCFASKINQQFLAVNKDTGEIYDLRNPECASQLMQNATKAEHLKKNKLPWEEWWKQKKQNNLQFLLASQQNDFLRCSQLLQDSKGDLKAETNFCDQQTGWAPLHFACLNCNIQLVNKLIVNEANINQETVNQVTPLMIAVEQASEDIVILLLKAGADINIRDENGNTALHIASMCNKLPVLDILLNRFMPNINIKNNNGKLAFELAKTEPMKRMFHEYLSKVSRNTACLQPQQQVISIHSDKDSSKFKTNNVTQMAPSPIIPKNLMQTAHNAESDGITTNVPSMNASPKQNSSTSQMYKGVQQQPQHLSSNQSNIPIQIISPKRLTPIQSRTGEFVSPSTRPTRETKQKNKISSSKQASKNCSPKSRENSKSRSFFSKKGFFNASGKENMPIKNAFSKRDKYPSRPMSTNIQSLSQFSNFDIPSECQVNSQSNSIQSIDQLVPLTKAKVTIHSFIIHSMIGKGSFGDVYLVQKKDNLVFYAMKVLQKSKMMKSNVIKYALTERNVLSITNHPFIVKLNYSFQTEEKLFLILDFAAAGDMGKLLQRQRILSESHARIYLSEILLALEDLHNRDIIFRDLKPDGHALLTDFGLSKEGVLDYTEGAKSFCGSIAYLAPEMLKRRGHGKAVDWYLFGVVMYEMLTGNPPYYANNKEDLFSNIQNAPLTVPPYLSEEAKSLLTALLERNPAMRLGCGRNDANEIKNHPFFKSVEWEQVLERKVKPPQTQLLQPSLNNYNSEQFIESLIGNSVEESHEKYISGWSFIANERGNHLA